MNIYVGNLPYETRDDDLREVFEAYGQVDSARVIIDKMTNRSKGFGFVEMSNSQEGNAAISKLDGSPFGGRNLKVNEARPREDSPRPSRDREYRPRY
jgi:RNA recognition motif-containing protein